MKHDLHGIIYTLKAESALGQLTAKRSVASLPVCARYRLIDFALSSMVNAGVRDVGVIMERDYESLLGHLAGGKEWGLSRRNGGLRLLPPFALPEAHAGSFRGCMEALRSVRSYIETIPQTDIVLSAGDVLANIDLTAAADRHYRSGADITAVCVAAVPDYDHHRFLPEADGFARKMLFCPTGTEKAAGVASAEVYILRKDFLLSLMDDCAQNGGVHFHRDALSRYIAEGGRVCICIHEGYLRRIASAEDYFASGMDMLNTGAMAELFPAGKRPVYTRERAEVSTYYGEDADVKNCLVADGCYIEGSVRSCILFPGVRVEKGAEVENCILMQDAIVRGDSRLRYVIGDKGATVSRGCTLTGAPALPVIIPKGETV